MGRKARYSAEEKISAVQEYLDGKGSMKTIAQRLGIAFQSFKQWVKNYEAMGIDAFKTNHNKHYSKAEKEQAVAAYLAGEGSHIEICQKFKILSTSQLRSWIKKYNGHEELKASRMPSDIQSIAKKAMVERLKNVYRLNWFPEDGAPYPVRIFLLKDEVMVTLDTSGDSLHKRGYRLMTSKAPLTETLAAALIMLTPWKKDRILVDPFCGSGTFPIEAAMIAANIAPGMNRQFTAEQWKNLIPKQLWYDTVEEAQDLMDADIQVDIQGYDIDAEVVKAARENAKRAGVDHLIHFQQRAVADLHHPKKYGFVITNPPYGERLEEKEDLPELYTQIGQAYAGLDSWSLYMITSYEDAERYIGRKADKNRKIYNGMIKTYFYQFMGPKPSKRREAAEKTIERKEQQ